MCATRGWDTSFITREGYGPSERSWQPVSGAFPVIRLSLRIVWAIICLGAVLWMLWSLFLWYVRPSRLECEPLEISLALTSPDGAFAAQTVKEACVESIFSTVVRTRVEVVGVDVVSAAADAGGSVAATVLTVWETHMLRPAVVMAWSGGAELEIRLMEPRAARLHRTLPAALSLRVLSGGPFGLVPERNQAR